MISNPYASKASQYFEHANMEVVSRVLGEQLHVLDVGCGRGALIAALKNRGLLKKSYGVEVFPGAANDARNVVDEVWNESIERFTPSIESQSLDYVICADILEHLREPEAVLDRIRPLLKPSGRLIVSVPNVCNRRVLWNLIIRNEWRYAPCGIMDATHLRWFTFKSARRLLEHAGFEICEGKYIFWGKAGAAVRNISWGGLSRFVAAQMLFVAQFRRK